MAPLLRTLPVWGYMILRFGGTPRYGANRLTPVEIAIDGSPAYLRRPAQSPQCSCLFIVATAFPAFCPAAALLASDKGRLLVIYRI